MSSSRVVGALWCVTALACTAAENTAVSVAPIVASATAYCQSGTTRSGEQTRPGVVAADPRVLPLGTVIRIDAPEKVHDGIYTVLDTGSSVKGRVVDIYMRDCRAAREFGRREVTVYVLESVLAQHRIASR